MAHFYAGASGKAKTEATRLGTTDNPTETFNNGWQSGVRVAAHYNPELDRDEFFIHITGGSGPHDGFYLGMAFRNSDGKLEFKVPTTTGYA